MTSYFMQNFTAGVQAGTALLEAKYTREDREMAKEDREAFMEANEMRAEMMGVDPTQENYGYSRWGPNGFDTSSAPQWGPNAGGLSPIPEWSRGSGSLAGGGQGGHPGMVGDGPMVMQGAQGGQGGYQNNQQSVGLGHRGVDGPGSAGERGAGGQDEIARGIFETAQAIGADPVDLATVISYETGGTFNPTQAGPTTQWGRHRGFIQFGEPQARQHGVDWNDPVRSQLGADGAVARYFRSSGYKPGMSFEDLYSTVNAGAPGLWHRSDANNGGAPGNVRDKVNNQMHGHRQKAMAMMGPLMGGQQRGGIPA